MSFSTKYWLIILAFFAGLSLLFALGMGSTPISFAQIIRVGLGQGQDPNLHTILYQLRLPRACAAFVTGALLALAGAPMQVLVRNPLADPYLLGTSGGAAFAALLCLLLGGTMAFVPLSAWGGSLVAMLLFFILSNKNNRWQSELLLLNGIILASTFSAFISLILFLSPNEHLRSMLFWLMGDLSQAPMPYFASLVLLVGVVYASYLAPQLNILLRGESMAHSLGISLTRIQPQIYVLATILTATAVALAGCIGFIGLLVPHLIRLLIGTHYRYLLPGSALLGGSLLVITDTLARSLFAPLQLPVGLVTALMGMPVFIFLIHRRTRCPIY